MIISNQADTKKNSITDDRIDSSSNEFNTLIIEIKNAKRRFRKLRTIKCKKTKIKINKAFDEKNKLKFEVVMNSRAEISLIDQKLAKRLELKSFNVSSCETVIIKNNSLKNYEVYFVQFEIQNENDVNRFFNDSFLDTNLD